MGTEWAAGFRNIDIDRVTISVQESDLERLQKILGELVAGKRIYEGFLTADNPSPNQVGFWVVFQDNDLVYADFHNLPYYYGGHTYGHRWEEYHQKIVSYVTGHPCFRSWRGHASRFDPKLLPTLIGLLNSLAATLFFSNLAISKLQEALDATPPGHPDRASRLASLANALQSRFELSGELGDLNEAISKLQEALDATPPDRPDRVARLVSLANALQRRSGRTGDLGGLEQAIQLLQQALAITTGDRGRAAIVDSLSIAYFRFERLRDFRISVRFPRRLSMGYEATFLVQIYPPAQVASARRRGDHTFPSTETEETGDDVRLPRDVEVELSCPVIKFDPRTVPMHILSSGAHTAFLGQPLDSARPGKHSARLAARNPVNRVEYHSFTFPVDIAAYAFDHVSRPSAGKIVGIPLGIAGLVAVAFGVFTQTSQAVLLIGVGAATTAFSVFGNILTNARYRRPSTTADDRSD